MSIILHLRIRVEPVNQPRFYEFLQRAIPVYEQPGGIKVTLLQNPQDPIRFIELVEYATQEDYDQDQVRVSEDPVNIRLLQEWRELISCPPEIEV